MTKLPTPRNPIARALRHPLFHKRIVRAKKGRGAYARRPRTGREG